MRNIHSWDRTRTNFRRRFATGLLVALSVTLVAFEWSTGDTRKKPIIYDPIDDPPIVVILTGYKAEEKKPVVEKREKKVNTGGTKIEISSDPIPDPGPPIDEKADPGPKVNTTSEIEGGSASTAPIMPPMPTLRPEVLPYFENCLEHGGELVNKCTEERIQRHLERHMRIPKSVRGNVMTTVTFEVDDEGRIGRIHCAPRVNQDVSEEIERVLRQLPRFIPGSQGEHPVSVYYQIPLRIRRE